MDRRKEYTQIIDRMQLPVNMAKYAELSKTSSLCREDTLICMHLKHIKEYLDVLEKQYDELVALSCDAAIKKVRGLLDQCGWA